eukprot:TRINITY_DN17685_c0_g1_i1.p1 TRINITY_DN17685_c0_g1~~TRINITY_DN17685_c0_g1_i1.p1  ORF type:complete len:416 (+),score=92.51 TRINITY_DN17685_c0_g1_i1:37-1284(+)
MNIYDDGSGSPDIQGTGAALSRRHWKDAESCRLCGTEFKMIVRKKHHCRHCGEVVCADCSKSKFKLETHNGGGKNMRVCNTCASKYEADKEHPLYNLLGDKLGEIYFYSFMRNGDDDVDQICELGKDKDLLDVLLERNNVLRSHRNAILERIKHASTMTETPSSEDEDDDASPTREPIVESGWRGNKKASMAQLLKEKASLESAIKNQRSEYKEANQRSIELCHLRSEIATLKAEQQYYAQQDNERAARGERAREEVLKTVKLRKRDFDLDRHHFKECELCNFHYNKKSREHHCRNCFRSVCNSCSSSRHGGQDGDGERLCDWCHCERVLESRRWMEAASTSLTHRAYWSLKLERLASDLRTIDGTPDRTQRSRTPSQKIDASKLPTPKELSLSEGPSLSSKTSPALKTSVLDLY